MTPTPLEDHYRLVEEREAHIGLADTLDLLREAGISFVVEGGWALAAHGSPTPSVDLDVLFPSDQLDQLRTVALNSRGIQIDAAAGNQALGLDWSFSDERNPLFGTPDLYYVPDDLLRNRIDTRVIRSVGGDLSIRVPRADALFFMKLKAFRDRSLQWGLSRDALALAALSREEAAVVRQRPTAYWERKAGKDLYDMCFLMGGAGLPPALIRTLLPGEELDRELLRALDAIPEPLSAFAAAMARRSRVAIQEPRRLLQLLGG